MRNKAAILFDLACAISLLPACCLASIYGDNEVKSSWFAREETVSVDTALNDPYVYVENSNRPSTPAHVVELSGDIVLHAELPEVPQGVEGSLCAVDGEPAKWYGLAKVLESLEWVELSGLDEPSEGLCSAVMEFKSEEDARYVRYSVNGKTATNGSDGWLGTVAVGGSSHGVKVAGYGGVRSAVGVGVMAGASASASGWSAGYGFTNATATVTLSSYDNSMGSAWLVVRDWSGTVVSSNEVASTDPVLLSAETTPGAMYTYNLEQGDSSTYLGSFLAGNLSTNGTPWFSASAAGGESDVDGGEWNNATLEIVEGRYYHLATGDAFSPSDNGEEKFACVDMAVRYTSLCEDLPDSSAMFGARTAVAATTNGWSAYVGGEWVSLSGAEAPSVDVDYVIRSEFDFVSMQKVRYSVKASNGAFAPLKGNGGEWLGLAAPESRGLSAVGTLREGLLAEMTGSFANAYVASVNGTNYLSFAEALSHGDVTLLTNVDWPSDAPVGVCTVNTNGYVLLNMTLGEDGRTAEVESGAIAIAGGGTFNIDLTGLGSIGIETTDKSAAEIRASLEASGENGIENWKNYVLGLSTTNAAAKPFAAPVQNADPAKLTFSLCGVSVNASSGATVKYGVQVADSPTSFDSASDPDWVDSDATVEMTADSSGVKYYRIKVRIETP